MTTPPKVRRFHLRASESPAWQQRGSADGDGAANPADQSRPVIRVEVQRGVRADAGSRQDRKDTATTDAAQLFAATDDGFGGMSFPGSQADDAARRAAAAPAHQPAAKPEPKPASVVAPQPRPEQPEQAAQPASMTAAAATPSGEADKLQAIRAENLTSRQLRMAARIAAMHEIEVASEYEAVLLLRERGIDPFHRGAVGRILSDAGKASQSAPSPRAPVVVPRPGVPAKTRRQEIAPVPPGGGAPGMPSRDELTEDRRAAEIFRIQRDIARRRRRNMMFLMARLAFFVGLPTILAGWYYFTQATPLYATYSQFLIQQADASGGGEMGGLLSSQMATNPDSVSVQSYLSSRDAMVRLDEELGFTRTFQDPAIDPLLRLPADATREQAYALYQDSVKIGYDPTEGVINMEVIAPDPKLSEQFSHALISYAEGQVDQMTARLREDQMKGAIESYEEAERKVQDAQRRVQELQERLGVLDPTAEGSVVMGQIATLEGELAKKRLELGQLQSNPRPNQSRVTGVQGDIARLETLIQETRSQLTEDQGNRASLAAISGELRIADSDLLTRQQLLATAAAQMETSRVEANKQVRYLSLSVAPVPPDEPTYPKALQNTVVAFLIFSGIYLMMSLTASILREQVSA